MKILIVNADDFGLNKSATDGIIQSHLAGSVTSATLMVNAPASERAGALARQYPSLGVGLHFNLTWGRPLSALSEVSALIDADGLFLSREVLARRLLTRRVPKQQIRHEFEAQMERLQHLGVRASHVDSHQHVHGFGSVFDVVAEYCAGVNIPMRVPWVASGATGGLARRFRRALLRYMLERSTSRWRSVVRWNDGLGSVFDLGAIRDEVDGSHYRRILQQARGAVFELMVHPVTDAAAMKGYTRIGTVAEAEWRYLCDGRLAALAEQAGFRLANYRDI